MTETPPYAASRRQRVRNSSGTSRPVVMSVASCARGYRLIVRSKKGGRCRRRGGTCNGENSRPTDYLSPTRQRFKRQCRFSTSGKDPNAQEVFIFSSS